MRECRIVSSKFDTPNSHKLQVARELGAYSAVSEAFSLSPVDVIDVIKDSGLRGKGGGGAPAGAKWDLMPQDSDKPSYLAVNCDESEPGTFKDRQIISKDPHLLIEGIIITCYAIRSHDAYIYIRGEYYQFQKILQEAIDEAYEAGILGSSVMDEDYRVDITIHRGAGAYICGEKSALLESMEGKRGHPRLKPKQKEPEWYFGNPTLVNNVETIASVPYIIKHGADGYREFGTDSSPGTLLFAMSGHVESPGVYEAEFGTSMMEYINHYGGGVKGGKKLKAVIPGGASTALLTADEVEKASLDYEYMNQEEAAKRMNVSRPTLTRIYDSARKKIASALVNSLRIEIAGGSVEFDDEWLRCLKCQTVFMVHDLTDDHKCPHCESTDLQHVNDEVRSHPKRRHSFHQRHLDKGHNGFCICPKCGKRVSHKPGKPCRKTNCPDCEISMRREGENCE